MFAGKRNSESFFTESLPQRLLLRTYFILFKALTYVKMCGSTTAKEPSKALENEPMSSFLKKKKTSRKCSFCSSQNNSCSNHWVKIGWITFVLLGSTGDRVIFPFTCRFLALFQNGKHSRIVGSTGKIVNLPLFIPFLTSFVLQKQRVICNKFNRIQRGLLEKPGKSLVLKFEKTWKRKIKKNPLQWQKW